MSKPKMIFQRYRVVRVISKKGVKYMAKRPSFYHLTDDIRDATRFNNNTDVDNIIKDYLEYTEKYKEELGEVKVKIVWVKYKGEFTVYG